MNASLFFQSRGRGGSVLIIVLIVCLGLVSLTLVFGHAMSMSYRGTDNDLAGRQAEAAVRGAERYAEVILTNSAVPHTLPDRANYQTSAVPLGEAFFWFIGTPLANDPQDKPAFGIVDEASKLNLNSANTVSLALLPEMYTDLATAIRQWRTTQGTDTTGSIAFNTVKAGPFESPEELALVNGGVDPNMLYGDDANLNHVLDPEEGPDGSASASTNASGGSTPSSGGASGSPAANSGGASGSFNPGLLEYVTVFSREPNKMSDGTQRGNVRSGINAIQNVLATALGDSRAQSIARSVGNGGFTSVVDFCQKAGLTPDEWSKVTPYLTMSSGNYQVGLINANTASVTVLSCIPGMTPSMAQNLVAARPTPGTTAAGNLQWVTSALGNQAGTIGAYLTAQSYQFSVDVAAVGRHGRGYRRTLFVLDFSTDPGGAPQIIYRRNLTHLGWALGSDARKSLQDTLAARQGGTPQ